jgi:hypothetical protein
MGSADLKLDETGMGRMNAIPPPETMKVLNPLARR